MQVQVLPSLLCKKKNIMKMEIDDGIRCVWCGEKFDKKNPPTHDEFDETYHELCLKQQEKDLKKKNRNN